jgi:hypothetical protein
MDVRRFRAIDQEGTGHPPNLRHGHREIVTPRPTRRSQNPPAELQAGVHGPDHDRTGHLAQFTHRFLPAAILRPPGVWAEAG